MSLFGNLSNLFGSVEEQQQKKPSSHSQSRKKNRRKPSKEKSFKKKHSQSKQTVQTSDAVREAQAKAREIIVEAKAEALSIRSKAEKDARTLSKKLEEQQRSLDNKLDRIDLKLSQITEKEDHLSKVRTQLQDQQKDLQDKIELVNKKLEEIAGITQDEAKKQLLDTLNEQLLKDKAQLITQRLEEAEAEAEVKAQEIIVEAMKYGATDYVPEYTVSVIKLPSEETKGKIIGRSGRNINAFEARTGVDVDLDFSPTEIKLSCFDPVRREIARISLEKLIKDGRIQPTRIEETVTKVEKEIDKVMLEAGKKLCHDLNVYNLPVELMRMIGKFKFRFSYGQNLISHTLEESRIGIKLAHELGLDVKTVTLGCLLHDIGKVSEEVDGSHVELGVKIAKKFNLPQAVIDCIAQHHEDEPFTGPEQMVVYIADAISGARPGARYENYDEYVQRLQKLESIATAHNQVKQAYAIQAGREVRVMLEPERSKDDDVRVLSLKIRDEIKDTMTYPGTVTVTVMRETRAKEVAN